MRPAGATAVPEAEAVQNEGAAPDADATQQTWKLIKKLGFPEIEKESKPTVIVSKVLASCTKRLTKLDEVKTSLESVETQVAAKPLGRTLRSYSTPQRGKFNARHRPCNSHLQRRTSHTVSNKVSLGIVFRHRENHKTMQSPRKASSP